VNKPLRRRNFNFAKTGSLALLASWLFLSGVSAGLAGAGPKTFPPPQSHCTSSSVLPPPSELQQVGKSTTAGFKISFIELNAPGQCGPSSYTAKVRDLNDGNVLAGQSTCDAKSFTCTTTGLEKGKLYEVTVTASLKGKADRTSSPIQVATAFGTLSGPKPSGAPTWDEKTSSWIVGFTQPQVDAVTKMTVTASPCAASLLTQANVDEPGPTELVGFASKGKLSLSARTLAGIPVEFALQASQQKSAGSTSAELSSVIVQVPGCWLTPLPTACYGPQAKFGIVASFDPILGVATTMQPSLIPAGCGQRGLFQPIFNFYKGLQQGLPLSCNQESWQAKPPPRISCPLGVDPTETNVLVGVHYDIPQSQGFTLPSGWTKDKFAIPATQVGDGPRQFSWNESAPATAESTYNSTGGYNGWSSFTVTIGTKQQPFWIPNAERRPIFSTLSPKTTVACGGKPLTDVSITANPLSPDGVLTYTVSESQVSAAQSNLDLTRCVVTFSFAGGGSLGPFTPSPQPDPFSLATQSRTNGLLLILIAGGIAILLLLMLALRRPAILGAGGRRRVESSSFAPLQDPLTNLPSNLQSPQRGPIATAFALAPATLMNAGRRIMWFGYGTEEVNPGSRRTGSTVVPSSTDVGMVWSARPRKNIEIYGGWSEKTVGKGEDAPPVAVVSTGSDRGALCIFDGTGGAGASVVHRDDVEATQAFEAAHLGRATFHQWIAAWVQSKEGFPDADDLKQALAVSFAEHAESLDPVQTNLNSSFARILPTTMASILFSGYRNHVKLRVLWAGDSRCYQFTPLSGLQQLSMDDTKIPDAFESLTEDPPLENLVCADRLVLVNSVDLQPRKPVVIITASDGCFGYWPTPPMFEAELLRTLVNSSSPSQWADQLLKVINEVARDDVSFSIAAVGFESFEAMKAAFANRAEHLRTHYYQPFVDLTASSPSREDYDTFRRDAWEQYKPTYEAMLPLTAEEQP